MKLNAERAALQVLGIAGSLRRASYNKRLLQAAEALAPPGMEIETFDLAAIPLFNADVEVEGDPSPVTALKEAVRQADALLIATPEYNHGIPGVLKNALDWASRGGRQAPLRGKPAAIVGAAPGQMGTVRAQEHLRQVLTATGAYVVPRPQLLVNHAGDKFDEAGTLTDEKTRAYLQRLLEALADWTVRLRAETPAAV